MFEITEAQNHELLKYARKVSPEYGEDAYQMVALDVLEKNPVITNLMGFFKVAIKHTVIRLCYKDGALNRVAMAQADGWASKCLINLRNGRKPFGTCNEFCNRKLHRMEEGNILYWTNHTATTSTMKRTCRTCRNLSHTLSQNKRRAVQKSLRTAV